MWDRFHYAEIQYGKFSAEDCKAIIDYHKTLTEFRSVFGRSDGAPLRDSGIYWLYSNDPAISWVFNRLNKCLDYYNRAYQYDVLPITSGQLTHYAPGQLYGWHVDIGAGPFSLRKISMVVQLSDPKDCEGGGLEVFNTDDESFNNRLPLGRGDVACFPSYIPHRATPVVSGERWSLVIWVLGERPIR